MKFRQLIILSCCLIFIGCGSTTSEQTELITENDKVGEGSSNIEDEELQSLFDECTDFTLWYGYTMNQGGSGPIYKLSLTGEVARFTLQDGARSESVDYTSSKFEQLKEIVKASNPKIYDINEHTDEQGRIVYETLNPAVELYVPGKGYYLDVEDTSTIEDFFAKLMEDNGFGDLNPTDEPSSFISTTENSVDTNSINNSSADISGTYVVAKSGGIRIRSEANTDAEIVAQLSEGEIVAVLDNTEGDEWIKVDYNGNEGYVPSEYVEIISGLSTESNNEDAAAGTNITLTSTINIRTAPDSSSSKVAVAYAGETVTVLQITSDGWSLVEYGKKQGYVRTDLLQE